MKKSIKIATIVIVSIIEIILVDSLQALLFDNSPIIRIREEKGYIVDRGILVRTYSYCGIKVTLSNFNARVFEPIVDCSKIDPPDNGSDIIE